MFLGKYTIRKESDVLSLITTYHYCHIYSEGLDHTVLKKQEEDLVTL